ncbi:MAG: LPD38 domain-containing protein, partial [Nitratireductor sp.]
EAALEASWRARDYIDFDRRGSGIGALARIVPFFNVSLQGIDKSARHAIVPVAKKVLGEALSEADGRALGEAYKTWARVGMLTAASVSLYALMSRHEDHDEVSTVTRSTHWMVKSGEKWVAIPKPFEFAAIINLGEAFYDAMVQRDASAASRWVDSLFSTLMPPSIVEDIPAVKTYYEVKTNQNFFTGGSIVPEWMQGMEPFLQYTARTSELSKQLGYAFNVSPAIVDHLIVSHTGSWGRSLLSLYDMAQADAPGFAWDDAPISRRFIKDASRGSQSVTMFWKMVGEREGVLEGKARSWRALMESGDEAGAADFYARQNDRAKAYIVLSGMEAKARRLHPMVRARGAIQAIGKIRRDMASGRLEDAFGAPVDVSAAARTAADDILSTLSMAIARNALVVMGEPGWAQRDIIPEDGFYKELEALSPALLGRLGDGYTTSRVWSFDAIQAAWPELRERLMREGGTALVADLVGRVEAVGPSVGGMKIRRKDRPVLDLANP